MLTLQTIADHFRDLGFNVRPQGDGLLVATQPQVVRLIGGDVKVSQGWVDVYPRNGAWIVRVTPHAAPHWIRSATSMADVEAFAREVLDVGLGRWKPTEGWFEIPDADPH